MQLRPSGRADRRPAPAPQSSAQLYRLRHAWLRDKAAGLYTDGLCLFGHPPPTADRLNTPSQCQRAFTALGAAPRGTPEAPATGKVERRFEPRQNRLGTLLAYEKITDDVLGGGGKVPVNPEYVLSRNRDHVVLRNYEGKIFEYIEGANPAPAFKRSENFDSPEFV